MPSKITMPRLDQSMEEGRIATWTRSEGDAVKTGDVLFEVETDKAAVEVEAEADGYLHHILVAEGDTAPVDGIVAWIYAEGETPGDPPAQTAAPKAAASPEPTPPQSTAPQATAPTPTPVPATAELGRSTITRRAITPAARQKAAALGLDVSRLTGRGPGGRIQMSDLLQAAAQPAAPMPLTESATPPVLPDAEPGDLFVQSTGVGDRLPMVMIHGFLADATGWEALAAPLAKTRRIHRIELPAHGRSPRKSISNFADLVSLLRHSFDDLGLERCHLVGHSLGGALALALADTRPRQVASLTLISPAGLGPEINGDAITGLARASRSESLGPWMKQLTADPDAISWSFVQAAAMARRNEKKRAAQQAMAQALFPDGVQGFDLNAALGRLDMETRIIWGREDHIIPWKHALRAPGTISLNLFERTGHMPHFEASDKILPLLDRLA
ncbi:acetoin dehydrogenase dihydrolipoyllysine-residue acetyltransferase subunit [Roseovarius sp.]|uniref:acetoin dehydrogenase dihydrolipoyllysine-residue acetyltransferase subunit n=1 Tax=Roseovarius sp. TaxID=1486281 RepID=UPI000C40AD42|nr:acetoin dehydrogenase dihydrolipoyllysine-residue acetyltransferase subunit [Roseovarius sp.]MAZ21232.1 acetoin dehydrogenase dihydrolipoyllysine-residue acetyltransferase subunit [Roseovarius sp.]